MVSRVLVCVRVCVCACVWLQTVLPADLVATAISEQQHANAAVSLLPPSSPHASSPLLVVRISIVVCLSLSAPVH